MGTKMLKDESLSISMSNLISQHFYGFGFFLRFWSGPNLTCMANLQPIGLDNIR